MRLFCLLCIPLFYLLRRSFSAGDEGGIRALVLGGLMVVVQYFWTPLIEPGGFGFSRWLSGFVDIVSLPALVPLVVCLLFVVLRVFSSKIDYGNFALLWLFPLAAYSSVVTSLPPSPIPLIVVPVLWIAQVVGISFFISCIMRNLRWYVIVPLALGIVALPLAATTSWWAFFSMRTFMGFLFLALSVIPAALSLVLGYLSMGKGSTPSMDERPESDMISRSSPIATPE